jgi:cysteine desulfurase family protein (TIGR01976 family)
MNLFDIASIRRQFPSLQRIQNGKPVAYLDGPAGTQVPQSVVDQISESMLHHNANRSGRFATSREVDAGMKHAHQVFADFLNAPCPESVAFGPNMTSLALQFSRAIAREWKAGDRILVSQLDHDANFTPWVLAAQDRGVEVCQIAVNKQDVTLDLESLRNLLTDRTRLVAVTAASNAVGSLTPVRQIADMVHSVGAELFVDAVHYAPHRCVDVSEWNCDYLVCSAYKFFGPHIGVLYGRPERMMQLTPYKLRPAPDSLPVRWMTGTQNHACIAGAAAAVEYIASLSESSTASPVAATQVSPSAGSLRAKLVNAFDQIQDHEMHLVQRLITGLQSMKGVQIFGIVDGPRMSQRAPTVAFRMDSMKSIDVAQRLGDEGVFVWHGNYYALPLTTALGTEPDGMVRIGCMHYNTQEEIDRTLDLLRSI